MPNLKQALKKIGKILAKAKEKKTLKGYTLIGGFAVSARAKPRATRDIDFLIDAEQSFYKQTLPDLLEKTGYSFKIFTSDLHDPLNKLIRIYDQNKNEIADLIPVFWKWQNEVIEKSEDIEIAAGIAIPVAQTEDLIILKLKAAGPQDIVDVESLIQAAKERKQLDSKRMMELAKRVKVDKKLGKMLLK